MRCTFKQETVRYTTTFSSLKLINQRKWFGWNKEDTVFTIKIWNWKTWFEKASWLELAWCLTFIENMNQDQNHQDPDPRPTSRPGSSLAHLWLIANHQLVIHWWWKIIHSEPKPCPLQHFDQSKASPGDGPVSCSLTGNNLQGMPRI